MRERQRIIISMVAAALALLMTLGCGSTQQSSNANLNLNANLVCVGVAVPCDAVQECNLIHGCGFWSICDGPPRSCDDEETLGTCLSLGGCVPLIHECTGSAEDCSSFTLESACEGQADCHWSFALSTCSGTAIDCGELSHDGVACFGQNGCDATAICEGQADQCADLDPFTSECDDPSTGCHSIGFCEGGYLNCGDRAPNWECEGFGPGCNLVEASAP